MTRVQNGILFGLKKKKRKKKSWCLQHGMNLENVMLTKISQAEKVNYYMVSLM
jgi:hypothetical protein